MTIPPRRWCLAIVAAFGTAILLLVLVAFVEEAEKGGRWLGLLGIALHSLLGLMVLMGSVPFVLQPWSLKLTPEALLVTGAFRTYRLPWDEIEDVELVTGRHMPAIHLRTTRPLEGFFPALNRKHDHYDLALFWWMTSASFAPLYRLLQAYAVEPQLRAEIAAGAAPARLQPAR